MQAKCHFRVKNHCDDLCITLCLGMVTYYQCVNYVSKVINHCSIPRNKITFRVTFLYDITLYMLCYSEPGYNVIQYVCEGVCVWMRVSTVKPLSSLIRLKLSRTK